MSDNSMTYDLVIIGAGPAGLAAAIRYKQLCQKNNKPSSVCILEKGQSIGAHILSGAVLEPHVLDNLLPQWREANIPFVTPVKSDKFLYLTKNKAIKLPTPKPMVNKNNFIISLGQICIYMAKHAEQLGVDIFPGFAATELLYEDNNKNNKIIGVKTGDMGLDKTGQKTPQYQPGINIYANTVLLGEGCHGSLTKTLITNKQTYGLGIKELWDIDPELNLAGQVIHTIGWPLDKKTYGGSFLYFYNNHKMAVGYVTGLDYKNPTFSPYNTFQQFKTHPKLNYLFSNATRTHYGARAINEGGFQSIPQLTYPGALLIGCSAGFLNVPKIKGIHLAMQSGIIAAESVFNNQDYTQHIKKSFIYSELKSVRNIRPSFKWGLWPGLLYSAIDTYLFFNKTPWEFSHKKDYTTLEPYEKNKKIDYSKPNNKNTFDRLTSVDLAKINHKEDQPCHLIIKNKAIPIDVNLKNYNGPEQYYCPAGVYEYLQDENQQFYLQINSANCVHCKTCDIKDPQQNINWVPPEGGSGPNYMVM